jgi:hypothetical protein
MRGVSEIRLPRFFRSSMEISRLDFDYSSVLIFARAPNCFCRDLYGRVYLPSD